MTRHNTASLREADPLVAAIVDRELRRQRDGLELIASENFASRAVIDAMGTPLTNKYAEGYPGRRYYGGCEVVDEVERLAIERAKRIFGAGHANVQPHSGAQANLAAYMALIAPGRPADGDVAAAWRAPDARRLRQPQRHDLPGRAVRRRPRHRAHRLRRGPRPGPAGTPEAAHRRRQRVRADHRLRGVPQHRRRGRGVPPGGHVALLGARGRRCVPLAGAPRAHHHHDHAQDAARPARRA